uniref:Immunoglobulin superfamily member 10 n=1 Tax=Calidris pygmaea TaxID=425635 RepID=A0A8C3JD67_9CHAR
MPALWSLNTPEAPQHVPTAATQTSVTPVTQRNTPSAPDTPIAWSPTTTSQTTPLLSKPFSTTTVRPGTVCAASGSEPAQQIKATTTAGKKSHLKMEEIVIQENHVAQPTFPARTESIHVEPDGTLIIKEVTVYDRGLYTCMAKNPAGTDTLVVKLQVIAAPPAILEEKRQRVEGMMGESLKFPCTVKGNPQPTVHWVLFDGTVVKPLQFVNAKLFLFSNGTLHLSNIAPSDSGNYECIATSSTGSERRVVSLVVEHRDMLPKIATASQEITRLNFGDKLLLNCTASGSPAPEISWGLPDGTVINNAMLADDSGHRSHYTCYAQNTLGRDEMKIRITVVMAAPQIKHNYKTYIKVKAGDTALLDCEAVGEPKPKIFWLLPSSDMISSSTDRHFLHVNGSLSVSQVKLLDAGEYMCVARNPGGDDTKLYKLDVVAKPPIINGLYANKTIMKVTAVKHSKKQIDSNQNLLVYRFPCREYSFISCTASHSLRSAVFRLPTEHLTATPAINSLYGKVSKLS